MDDANDDTAKDSTFIHSTAEPAAIFVEDDDASATLNAEAVDDIASVAARFTDHNEGGTMDEELDQREQVRVDDEQGSGEITQNEIVSDNVSEIVVETGHEEDDAYKQRTDVGSASEPGGVESGNEDKVDVSSIEVLELDQNDEEIETGYPVVRRRTSSNEVDEVEITEIDPITDGGIQAGIGVYETEVYLVEADEDGPNLRVPHSSCPIEEQQNGASAYGNTAEFGNQAALDAPNHHRSSTEGLTSTTHSAFADAGESCHIAVTHDRRTVTANSGVHGDSVVTGLDDADGSRNQFDAGGEGPATASESVSADDGQAIRDIVGVEQEKDLPVSKEVPEVESSDKDKNSEHIATDFFSVTSSLFKQNMGYSTAKSSASTPEHSTDPDRHVTNSAPTPHNIFRKFGATPFSSILHSSRDNASLSNPTSLLFGSNAPKEETTNIEETSEAQFRATAEAQSAGERGVEETFPLTQGSGAQGVIAAAGFGQHIVGQPSVIPAGTSSSSFGEPASHLQALASLASTAAQIAEKLSFQEGAFSSSKFPVVGFGSSGSSASQGFGSFAAAFALADTKRGNNFASQLASRAPLQNANAFQAIQQSSAVVIDAVEEGTGGKVTVLKDLGENAGFAIQPSGNLVMDTEPPSSAASAGTENGEFSGQIVSVAASPSTNIGHGRTVLRNTDRQTHTPPEVATGEALTTYGDTAGSFDVTKPASATATATAVSAPMASSSLNIPFLSSMSNENVHSSSSSAMSLTESIADTRKSLVELTSGYTMGVAVTAVPSGNALPEQVPCSAHLPQSNSSLANTFSFKPSSSLVADGSATASAISPLERGNYSASFQNVSEPDSGPIPTSVAVPPFSSPFSRPRQQESDLALDASLNIARLPYEKEVSLESRTGDQPVHEDSNVTNNQTLPFLPSYTIERSTIPESEIASDDRSAVAEDARSRSFQADNACSTGSSLESPVDIAKRGQSDELYCSLCNVKAASVAQLAEHKAGKKHAKNIAKISASGNPQDDSPSFDGTASAVKSDASPSNESEAKSSVDENLPHKQENQKASSPSTFDVSDSQDQDRQVQSDLYVPGSKNMDQVQGLASFGSGPKPVSFSVRPTVPKSTLNPNASAFVPAATFGLQVNSGLSVAARGEGSNERTSTADNRAAEAKQTPKVHGTVDSGLAQISEEASDQSPATGSWFHEKVADGHEQVAVQSVESSSDNPLTPEEDVLFSRTDIVVSSLVDVGEERPKLRRRSGTYSIQIVRGSLGGGGIDLREGDLNGRAWLFLKAGADILKCLRLKKKPSSLVFTRIGSETPDPSTEENPSKIVVAFSSVDESSKFVAALGDLEKTVLSDTTDNAIKVSAARTIDHDDAKSAKPSSSREELEQKLREKRLAALKSLKKSRKASTSSSGSRLPSSYLPNTMKGLKDSRVAPNIEGLKGTSNDKKNDLTVSASSSTDVDVHAIALTVEGVPLGYDQKDSLNTDQQTESVKTQSGKKNSDKVSLSTGIFSRYITEDVQNPFERIAPRSRKEAGLHSQNAASDNEPLPLSSKGGKSSPDVAASGSSVGHASRSVSPPVIGSENCMKDDALTNKSDDIQRLGTQLLDESTGMPDPRGGNLFVSEQPEKHPAPGKKRSSSALNDVPGAMFEKRVKFDLPADHPATSKRKEDVVKPDDDNLGPCRDATSDSGAFLKVNERTLAPLAIPGSQAMEIETKAGDIPRLVDRKSDDGESDSKRVDKLDIMQSDSVAMKAFIEEKTKLASEVENLRARLHRLESEKLELLSRTSKAEVTLSDNVMAWNGRLNDVLRSLGNVEQNVISWATGDTSKVRMECRPHSLEDFLERLHTFNPSRWSAFGEVGRICPVVCARHGWFNSSKNTITSTEGAVVQFNADTVLEGGFRAYEAEVRRVREEVVAKGHKMLSQWIGSCCPDSFCDLKSLKLTKSDLEHRAESFRKFVVRDVLSEDDPVRCLLRDEAYALAALLWEIKETPGTGQVILSCEWCKAHCQLKQNPVGMRRFDRDGPAHYPYCAVVRNEGWRENLSLLSGN